MQCVFNHNVYFTQTAIELKQTGITNISFIDFIITAFNYVFILKVVLVLILQIQLRLKLIYK